MLRRFSVALLLTFGSIALLGTEPAAAADADIELPVQARSIDYDETNDLFLVATEGPDHDSQCGLNQLHVFDRSGTATWEIPAPVPHHWMIHEGTLFVASGDLIRSFDVATGALQESLTTSEGVDVEETFIGGDFLWFNHGPSGQRGRSVDTFFPGVDQSEDITIRFFEDAHAVAGSPEHPLLLASGQRWPHNVRPRRRH